jgi:hypothetical protein
MSDEEAEEEYINPMELALLGMKVSVGKDGQALRNGDPNAEYKLVLRTPTNGGARSPKALSLKACKGLKGCEFAGCAEKALGTLPKNLRGLCSTSIKKEQKE